VVAKYYRRIAFDLDEFYKDYRHPAGELFNFEITHKAVAYVYAEVIGTAHADQVTFDLNSEALVSMRKAH
jgi:hypothetical protein